MWELMLAQEVTRTAPRTICECSGTASHVASLISRHVRLIVSSASSLFRVSQRVVVRWKEGLEEKFCGGIVVASYNDGCAVDFEVSPHPLVWHTRFFTLKEMLLWNTTTKEENIVSY